ncbi:MAG: response regulator [Candidatus Andersenbacteria bacterium]
MSLTDADKTILVVEDETSLLRVIADQLHDEGYTVITATNGQAGLDAALSHHPDLIFLDVVMPQMDGIMMLKKLRRDSWGKRVPVIILTNVSEANTIDMAMEYGVHEYIVKADWQLDDVVRMAKTKLEAVPDRI